MARALEEARNAAALGEVPVGAVILDADGAVVAAAGNRKETLGDPTAHAEILAIREACARVGDGWRLANHTLVVTLEPCAMCAGAIVAARIPRLVFGAFDEKAGAVASVWDLVRDPRQIHRVEVIPGIMARHSAELLREFFGEHRG